MRRSKDPHRLVIASVLVGLVAISVGSLVLLSAWLVPADTGYFTDSMSSPLTAFFAWQDGQRTLLLMGSAALLVGLAGTALSISRPRLGAVLLLVSSAILTLAFVQGERALRAVWGDAWVKVAAACSPAAFALAGGTLLLGSKDHKTPRKDGQSNHVALATES